MLSFNIKMTEKTFLELLEKILNLSFKFMKSRFGYLKASQAIKSEFENTLVLKLLHSTRFYACLISPVLLMLIIATFLYYEWNTLSMSTISENVAFASKLNIEKKLLEDIYRLKSCSLSNIWLHNFDEEIRKRV